MITFVHQACQILWEDISLHTQVGGLNFSSPFFINAMTGGGGERTKIVNAQLARIAKQVDIPMAVGSQMAALKDPDERTSYAVVREENPNGLVFANLGSEATVEQAKQAVEMIEADALQIHLNVIQELTMPEGDRDFKDAHKRIEQIINGLSVPVIIKETGFGLSRETVHKLKQLNVGAIDVGGFGGTNFAMIENEQKTQLSYFDQWGIPTAASVIEAKMEASDTSIIASGGIQNPLDIVKFLALGASAVGLAGFILKLVVEHGEDETCQAIEEMKEDIKMMMVALGATTVSELQYSPLILNGELYPMLTVMIPLALQS
jgi:isopentenyl-diphosphate delta-isomerase